MGIWRGKDHKVFKGRIYDRDGRTFTRTLTTDSPELAAEIRDFLTRMRRHRRFDVLQLIIDRTFSALELFMADRDGILNAYIEGRQKAKEAEIAKANEPDLDKLLEEWKPLAKGQYYQQVRVFIPEGVRFPLSQFTRKTAVAFLRGLKFEKPTKNRYKAALSQFNKFLIEQEITPHNVIRDIDGFGENPPRDVYYDDATARAVINAMENPFRALAALMCGTATEISAARLVRVSDVNPDNREVKVFGTKTKYRRRSIRFLDEWCWDVFWTFAKTHIGTSPLFGNLKEKHIYNAHHAAVAAVNAEYSRPHDWRHTFSVRERRKGTPLQIIKHQMGHSQRSNLVEINYGAYVPSAEDYDRLPIAVAKDSPATSRATAHRKRVK